MTLLRCFAQVNEYGGITLGRNFMLQMGLKPNSFVLVKVMRITGSSRDPYLIVYKPGNEPRSTALETVIFETPCRIDEKSNILLDNKLMAESGFEPGLSVEFKLVGPTKAPWLAIRNKGPLMLTTLQDKMGLKRQKKLKTMRLDY